MYIDGLRQARKSLPLWESALPDRFRHGHVGGESSKLPGEMIEGMKATAAGFGIAVK